MKTATNQERLIQLFDSDSRTDTAIAEVLGVSKQTISMWRHGTRSPKKSMLVKIAEVYNVSIEWLMGFDVEKEDTRTKRTITLPDSTAFSRMLNYMSLEDYDALWHIFDRTHKKMQEKGIEP